MTSEVRGKQNCTEMLNEEETCVSDTLSISEICERYRESFKKHQRTGKYQERTELIWN
jgi:hypothetical protein